MPPVLHPRSGFTTTLFTSTLAISFLVVGLPHILPCPVNPRQYADGCMVDAEGRPLRRRRKVSGSVTSDGDGEGDGEENMEMPARKTPVRNAVKRECPVPKPGGLVGQVLGFKRENGERQKAPIVRVETMRRREEKDRENGG